MRVTHAPLLDAVAQARQAVNTALDAAIADQDLVGRHLDVVVDRLIEAQRAVKAAQDRVVGLSQDALLEKLDRAIRALQ